MSRYKMLIVLSNWKGYNMTRRGNGLYYDVSKVIGGKRFDTSKAELIGHRQFGQVGNLNCMDFRHFEEALYRTLRSKQFFLAGRGGAMSKYHRADPIEYGSIAGEGIIPLSHDEALEWAGEHLDADDVEKFFPIEEA